MTGRYVRRVPDDAAVRQNRPAVAHGGIEQPTGRPA
jgi:hypothetical protein